MMRYLLIFIVTALIAFQPARVAAEIVVITNSSSGITELTRRQVVDIYMGRALITFNGQRPAPYDNAENVVIREAFYRQLIGKSIASVNAYWAGLLFAGRASPPRRVADSAAMLKVIEENPNAIGYIDVQELNDDVNIIFRLPDDE